MKIAFDHQIFSSQGYGGISRYYIRLAQALQNLGENPKIFAPIHKNEYLKHHPSLKQGKYFKNFIPKTTGFINFYNCVAGGLEAAGWKPDILHETYYAKSIFARSTPIVTTIHDMIPELFAGQDHKSNRLVCQKRKSVERADHIICVSENTKKDLLEFYSLLENQVSVVYHGFELFPKADKSMNSKNTLSDHSFLLYVGNRSGYKNFDKFIKSFANSTKLCKEYKVIAFGGGVFSNREKEMLQKLGVSNKVYQQTGDDQVLRTYYRNASALVFPSLYEGFGMPILEAMAYGCPVIASNSGSIPEIAGEAAELFDPASLESIRFSLEKVLKSEDFKGSLIKKGYKQIKKFSWEKCARQTRQVYKKFLK